MPRFLYAGSTQSAAASAGLMRQMLIFGIVGTIGFAVNAVALQIALLAFGPITAQFIAFPFAVTATWWLNRRYTFRSELPWRREWMRYVTANFIGWIVMNGTYVALVVSSTFIHAHPVIALAAGSLAGMTFNFAVSKWVVFR